MVHDGHIRLDLPQKQSIRELNVYSYLRDSNRYQAGAHARHKAQSSHSYDEEAISAANALIFAFTF